MYIHRVLQFSNRTPVSISTTYMTCKCLGCFIVSSVIKFMYVHLHAGLAGSRHVALADGYESDTESSCCSSQDTDFLTDCRLEEAYGDQWEAGERETGGGEGEGGEEEEDRGRDEGGEREGEGGRGGGGREGGELDRQEEEMKMSGVEVKSGKGDAQRLRTDIVHLVQENVEDRTDGDAAVLRGRYGAPDGSAVSKSEPDLQVDIDGELQEGGGNEEPKGLQEDVQQSPDDKSQFLALEKAREASFSHELLTSNLQPSTSHGQTTSNPSTHSSSAPPALVADLGTCTAEDSKQRSDEPDIIQPARKASREGGGEKADEIEGERDNKGRGEEREEEDEEKKEMVMSEHTCRKESSSPDSWSADGEDGYSYEQLNDTLVGETRTHKHEPPSLENGIVGRTEAPMEVEEAERTLCAGSSDSEGEGRTREQPSQSSEKPPLVTKPKAELSERTDQGSSEDLSETEKAEGEVEVNGRLGEVVFGKGTDVGIHFRWSYWEDDEKLEGEEQVEEDGKEAEGDSYADDVPMLTLILISRRSKHRAGMC